MFFCDFSDQPHLIHGKYGSRRISRVDAADCSGLFCNQRFNLLSLRIVIAFFGLGCDRNDFAAGRSSESMIIRIERFWNQHLVSLVEDRKESHVQSLGTACSYDHVLSADIHAVCFEVIRYSVLKIRDTAGLSVSDNLVLVVSDGFHEASWSFDIRLADVQMINLFTGIFSLLSDRVEFPNRRKLHRFDFV